MVGQIYNDAPNDLIIKNCCFRKNSVSDDKGGAIYSKGKVCVEDSTFDSNKANVDGGAIFCENDVNVTRCLFKNNKAEGAILLQCYGGAIRSYQNVWINNSTFEKNTAADYGGAVYAKNIYVNKSFDPIQNLTTVSHFYNNSAKDNDGGALYSEEDTIAYNARFEYNEAYDDGGAICCKNTWVHNCLFCYNAAKGAHFSKCKGGSIFAKGDIHLDDTSYYNNLEDYLQSSIVFGGFWCNGKLYVLGTFRTLQSLVDDAKVGSTLYLRSDYYGGKNSKVTVNKNLTIDGQGHTIDCLCFPNCYAFYSTKGNVVLKNLNINNGRNNDNKRGGAIYIGGSASYTLINCNFTNNRAEDYGGAICNDATNDLVLKNCLFKDNWVRDDNGGAIYSKGKVYAEDSIFDSNSADLDGGAISCEKDVNVTHCIFKSNMAGYGLFYQCRGGAIRSKQNVHIINSTFENNLAADYGGAVYAKNIYVNAIFDSLDNPGNFSHFYNNTAKDNNGGALGADNDIIVAYTIFKNNNANDNGGEISSKRVYLISNNTFINNLPQVYGAVSLSGEPVEGSSNIFN